MSAAEQETREIAAMIAYLPRAARRATLRLVGLLLDAQDAGDDASVAELTAIAESTGSVAGANAALDRYEAGHGA